MGKIKLLLADDSEISRSWLKGMLPVAIVSISDIKEVENGEQAVSVYKEFQPALVFLDITMPVKNGFEALEEIIAYDKDAKVIMISADRQESTKKRVIGLGAVEILNKPVNKTEFKKVLLDTLFGD